MAEALAPSVNLELFPESQGQVVDAYGMRRGQVGLEKGRRRDKNQHVWSRFYVLVLKGICPWVEKIPWRRKQQPTPVFLFGKSHGQRSLSGYIP